MRVLRTPPSEARRCCTPAGVAKRRTGRREIVHAGSGETALIISQAENRRFEPDIAIRFHTISETVPLELRGRKARLEAGICEDQSACSRIQWDEDGGRVMLVMKAPSVELIRIAESMLH